MKNVPQVIRFHLLHLHPPSSLQPKVWCSSQSHPTTKSVSASPNRFPRRHRSRLTIPQADSRAGVTIHLYSRGQPKPTNRLSVWEVNVSTRFFSELSSKFQKTSKKASPKFFPRGIRKCQIFGLEKSIYLFRNRRQSIKNCIQMHHRSSRNTAVPLLLPYCPLSSISGQSHAIGWHPPPRAVDESPYHLDWTWIEGL